MSEFEPQTWDVCLKTGDTWILGLTFENVDADGNVTGPIDLTGRTVRVQIRTAADASGAPALELTDGSGLTLDLPNGVVDISAAISLAVGSYVWEIEIGGSTVSSPVSGTFKVEQDIVR